ncbi:response regulator [bacterium]|nr:response regulator [bacterium]
MKKVLIVEDEAIVAEDLRESLVEVGYQIVGTTDRGEEAIVLAQEHCPDLILMDVKLAGVMDGIDSVRHILSNRSVSVVFLTAYSDSDTKSRIDGIAPCALLLKPYTEEQLHATVRSALAHPRERIR